MNLNVQFLPSDLETILKLVRSNSNKTTNDFRSELNLLIKTAKVLDILFVSYFDDIESHVKNVTSGKHSLRKNLTRMHKCCLNHKSFILLLLSIITCRS
jgi:hypothetical protein